MRYLFLVPFLLFFSSPSYSYTPVYYSVGAYNSGYYFDLINNCRAAVSIYNSREDAAYSYTSYNATRRTCNASNGSDTIGISYYQKSYKPEDHDPVVDDVPPEDEFDSECEAIKPTILTLDHNPGGSYTWEYQGCEFTTSSVWLETPSGKYTATVATAEALEVEPPAGDETDPDVTSTSGGDDASDDFEQSVRDQCPWNYYEFDGQGYCYFGDDAATGAEYDDGSVRQDNYDGTYSVTDPEGNTTHYNANGTVDHEKTSGGSGPTAPTGPGSHTGGSGDDDGEGSGDGQGGADPGSWSGNGDYEGFGGEDDLLAQLSEKKQEFTDELDTIRSEVQSRFASIGASGSCQSNPQVVWRDGVTADLSACGILEQYLPIIRPAVLLLGACIAGFLVLGGGRRA